jgi:hypothetical protein
VIRTPGRPNLASDSLLRQILDPQYLRKGVSDALKPLPQYRKAVYAGKPYNITYDYQPNKKITRPHGS